MTSRILIILLLTTSFNFKYKKSVPRLTQLTRSECVEDCTDPDKLFSTTLKDTVFKINFGLLLNCCGHDTISFKFRADTLSIKTKHIPKYTFKMYNGFAYKVEYPQGYCECDCYFIYDAEISGVEKEPKYIKVNGRYLKKP